MHKASTDGPTPKPKPSRKQINIKKTKRQGNAKYSLTYIGLSMFVHLFLRLFLPRCVYIYLSLCLFVCVHICLSVCVSLCPSVCLLFRLFGDHSVGQQSILLVYFIQNCRVWWASQTVCLGVCKPSIQLLALQKSTLQFYCTFQDVAYLSLKMQLRKVQMHTKYPTS